MRADAFFVFSAKNITFKSLIEFYFGGRMKRISLVILALMVILPSSLLEARDFGFGGMAALAGGYNPTWGSYGGVDLRAQMAVDRHLDVYAGFEGLTAGSISTGISVRPKIQFAVGTLYFDAGVLYKHLGGDGIFDFVSRGSLGWQMKHFDVQLGMFNRTMGSIERDIHTDEEMIGEPFNVLYRLQYNLKGNDNPWDLWCGMSDFTAFEFERHWSPIFYLGGRRTLGDDLQLFGQTEIKPTGMFHLNACFYGIVFRVGAFYSF